MLRLTSRARYALRAMIALAKLSEKETPTSLGKVSERTNISRKYLEQLTIPLKNADLIRGISGKGGGYVLTRSPENIKAGEVIEAAIGKINVVDCVRKPEKCFISDFCACRRVYSLINERIVSALNSFTIADLAGMNPDSVECDASGLMSAVGSKIRYVRGSSPCATK